MLRSLVLSLLGAALLVGCSADTVLKDPHEGHDHAKEDAAAPAAAPEAMPPHGGEESAMAPHGAGAAKGALGTPQGNQQFAIILKADPEQPKVGQVKLVAKILHEGNPYEKANVQVNLSMPDMNHGGPKADLIHTSGNAYEGTIDLKMPGTYKAEVVISTAAKPVKSAIFTYTFDVSK